ncbi:MAG: Malate:quinone oxidoreductase (EC [uncultured Thiotrichaceae bacterium]|uniref:Probable malate:quinone oxidoreductase n=1 Tax=uncultured Thiotrichaceae bacterium TaxID=298394 RepID=A0A6S6TF76_9GAMM|nr:MAG: Malate:quinone oxidoreductase (EC [uncultured Thiotrichaceae bacterium]
MESKTTDILLIGAGAMSATLGSVLKQLDPSYSVTMIEKLDDVVKESTDGWNNAGTGHAAYCELNYTPEGKDGTINIERAFGINARFEVSLSYWAYMVNKGAFPEPESFIVPTPHMSFVWGEDNVDFLRRRYEALTAHPMFTEMQFTDDPEVIREWMPLVMEGRDSSEKVAATRVDIGTDVNFASLSRGMIDELKTYDNFDLRLSTKVKSLTQGDDKRWTAKIKNSKTGEVSEINAGFVFIGAGGASLTMLQKSGIAEGKGYGGFPVSGQWLVCNNPKIVERHLAKVYGKAPVGSPPMSVPHLDTRVIDGKNALLFGPFAGFTTKFLKTGSMLDLIKSLKLNNLWPMFNVGIRSMDLIKYLITEVMQTHKSRMKALRNYFPEAKNEDWTLATAGQRVQIIKRCPDKGGKLEFGTEVISSEDRTLSSLLGASPGASVMVPIILQVIEECFADRLANEWMPKVKEMIPSYAESIVSNEDLFLSIRRNNLQSLRLSDSQEHAPVEPLQGQQVNS